MPSNEPVIADAIRTCWRCGKVMIFNNGDIVLYEVFKGHVLPVHKKCHELKTQDVEYKD